jgi:hypothetical protein
MASHVRPHFCNGHTAEHRRAHRKRRSGSPNCRKSNISMVAVATGSHVHNNARSLSKPQRAWIMTACPSD